jgi:hypothetical protein
MKKSCLLKLLILIIISFGIIYFMLHLYDPENETVEIKQKVGGTLICKSILYSDIHDWQYNVKYEYKRPDNKIYKIGEGIYYAKEWPQNEQLVKFHDWYILKTGASFGSEKIIIGKLSTPKWKEFEFDPNVIEKDSLWRITKTKSLLDYCCGETKVLKIENGLIQVSYKFRIDEKNTDLMGNKILNYRLDKFSGEPMLQQIQ